MNYDWNWGIFLQATIDGSSRYGWWMLSGFGLTIVIALTAWMIALALGVGLGVARTLPYRGLRALVVLYVELFRNIPLLVQLFFWYYIAPVLLLPVSWQAAVNQAHPVLVQALTAILCLGLFTAARVCEQVRAGIEAQPKGQFNAGYAVGLTRMQAYRHVILPMAFRVVIPPLTSEFLNVFKNSSVASLIGLMELLAQTKQTAEFSANLFEAFTLATLIYFTLNMSLMLLMRRIEKKVAVPGLISVGGK